MAYLEKVAPDHVDSVRRHIIDLLVARGHGGDGAHLPHDPARAGRPARRRDASRSRCRPGFGCHVANVGVKDDTDDFVVIAADAPCAAAGVFTRSRFVGPSVTISRRNLADGTARAVVVVSKNANVANGPAGDADAEALVDGVADRLGCPPDDVLVASTGVIGRRYPMERVLAGVAALPASPPGRDLRAAARGIMTTDTVEKVAAADGRRRPGPGRRHGQGRRDDRARHGDDDRRAAHRRRRSARPSSTPCSAGSSTTRSTASASTPTRRPATPPWSWPAARPGRSTSTTSRSRCASVAGSLTRQIARDGEGAETLIEVARRRGPRPRPGQAGGQGDRQLAARQDGRPRRRPELGPGGDGRSASAPTTPTSTRSGSSSASATARCTRRSVDDAELAELSDYLRGDEVRIHVSPRHRRRRLHRLGLRPHRRLRPHQRRLHHLSPPRRTFERQIRTRSIGAVDYFGGMRMPPSTRIVSAFM